MMMMILCMNNSGSSNKECIKRRRISTKESITKNFYYENIFNAWEMKVKQTGEVRCMTVEGSKNLSCVFNDCDGDDGGAVAARI